MPGPVKIILRRGLEADEASVELRGPKGEASKPYWFELLWRDATEWHAVFRSLELYEGDPRTWPTRPEIVKQAQKLGLFLRDEIRPSQDRFRIIGETLFRTVFGSERIRSLLTRLLHAGNDIPVVEFHIQDEGSFLQGYPWELLFDQEGFLFEGRRAFPVRHVDFEEPIPQLDLPEVLSVLYVACTDPRKLDRYDSSHRICPKGETQWENDGSSHPSSKPRWC